MRARDDKSRNRPRQQRRDPLRLVLTGCGAVTRLYYAEALNRLHRTGVAQLVGIFDPDARAMKDIGDRMPGAHVAASYSELLRLDAAAIIVASPPRFHADQAIEALKAGLHVFCEKPLATSTDDALRMLAMAEDKRLTVGLGLVRRHLPTTRFIKAILEAKLIGRIGLVEGFEGGPFQWPVATPKYFDRPESGGGILQDIGSHCLDLFSWWFGKPSGIAYEDDAMGGIEANCLLKLEYDGFDAHIRLSRDWARPNIYRIEGDRGWITWEVNEPQALELGLTGSRTMGKLRLGEADGSMPDFIDCFASQIANFAHALRSGSAPLVAASDGLNVLKLVEQCYASRRLMDMPWLSEAERESALAVSGQAI